VSARLRNSTARLAGLVAAVVVPLIAPLFVGAPAACQEGTPVERIVRAWAGRPELSNSTVGVEVMELPSGRVLASFNGNRRFTPASTAKVFTCACAHELLGGDFRYRTRLLAYGKVKHGRLEGDLVLSASQDPTLESSDLRQLFAQVLERGVKYVEGRLLAQPVPGGGDSFTPSWLAEDWGQEWMPVSSSLVLDRNLAPGKDPGRGLKVSALQPDELSAMYKTLVELDYTPGWVFLDEATNTVKVARSVNPQLGGSLTVSNPGTYNLKMASSIARQAGIHFSGRHNTADAGFEPALLAEHESKPLSSIVTVTLHESDNLYAQQLLRTLGLKRPAGGERHERTLEERGLEALYDWLLSVGVSKREVVLLDGCGLSRKSCVSPHALNTVLKRAAGAGVDGAFLALLRADGPSKYQSGSYQFKTGAMDSVRSISGVLTTAGRQTLAVTAMVNGHSPSVRDVRAAMSALTSQLRSLTSLGAADAAPPGKPPARPAGSAGVRKSTAKPKPAQRKPAQRKRSRRRT